ncbi:MAG: hypothetical protein KAR54_00645 [Candidatus Pacebacteria bacterium]|nr:hypothetical protein [Candidatus Paceibacterota bacterium]
MMNKLLYIFIFISLSIPYYAKALWNIGDPLITCNTKAMPNPCTFGDLITLISNIIDFILYISAPVSAIMFSYAGYLYLTSGGNPSKRAQGNKIFINVLLGLFFIVGAWLIVKAILMGLKVDFDEYKPLIDL